MIHPLLLLLGVFMIGWGVVICAMLISMTLKAKKGLWLVTIPGIFIVAFLGFDFACHMLHASPTLPHEKQIAAYLRWGLDAAALLLIALRLYEWWRKKRAQEKTIPPLPQKPETL